MADARLSGLEEVLDQSTQLARLSWFERNLRALKVSSRTQAAIEAAKLGIGDQARQSDRGPDG